MRRLPLAPRPSAGRLAATLVGGVLLAALAGCSGADEPAPSGTDGERIVVASTLPLITELVERIGGDRVEVLNLVPLGVDEHSYHPPTTLPREIVRADLVLTNGYYLEETLLGIVVENVREDVPVVAVSRGLALLDGGHVHEFIEGELDRASIDVAVGEIGGIVEASLAGTLDPLDAIDEVDVIIHRLPSGSRTEAIRGIDSIVHEVPRGQATAEEAVARIAEVTRGYEPAPGPEAAIAQVVAVIDQHEGGDLTADDAMGQIDRLLDRLTLDQRNEAVRDIDAAVAEWVDGTDTAEVALSAIHDVLEGGAGAGSAGAASAGAESTGGGALLDELVVAEGDPHLWLDARNMAVYAENVRDALVRVDPEGAAEYEARAAEVVAELEALHEELLTTLAAIPAEQRKLVVFHDAFQYFAAAYDFEVSASVAPANPNQERSAAAIAEIIEQVRAAGVSTIYREPQYSSQSLDLIAADSNSQIGIIHSIPSEDAPTYAEMMRANAAALVEGLADRD
ncbi:MAG: hypothetical protein DWG80_07380 [Chloroflexi bacterium]|nr:hypothetical protein [Chloroflexota bacterium]